MKNKNQIRKELRVRPFLCTDFLNIHYDAVLPLGQKKLHYMFALSRSGHNCILDWLQSGHPEGAVRLHCAEGAFLNLGSIFKPKLLKRTDIIFVNIEDSPSFDCFDGSHLGNVVKNYIIMRDPFNMLSSRIRLSIRDAVPFDVAKYMDIWIRHAKELLRTTTNIDNVTGIIYNEWFKSESYRNSLAESLGIHPVARLVQVTNRHGSGSSFDGRSLPPSKMRVIDRWQQVDPEKFSEYKENLTEEIIELSIQIFGKDFVHTIINSEIWRSN